MSLKHSLKFIAVLVIATVIGSIPLKAHAGPLCDWLFGRSTGPAYPVGQPVPVSNGYAASFGNYNAVPNYAAGYGANYVAPIVGTGYAPNAAAINSLASPTTGYAGNYGNYYSSQLPAIGPAGAAYSVPLPSGVAAATLPQTYSYVPNFQSNAYRAPVTYYRPLMTTDPNSGNQVVALAPCTSYEYMNQQSPALGRSALFGSAAAPQVLPPPAQALPTYTLPSGGVPLSTNTVQPASPYSAGYYGNYGSYAPVMPPVANGSMSVGPAGTYPTSPLGQTQYYGTTSGGSTGSFGGSTIPQSSTGFQSVPGLVAPAAPSTSPSQLTPSTPAYNVAPAYNGAPVYPGQSSVDGAPSFGPAAPNGYGAPPSQIYPPAQSNDPASLAPTLPSASTENQLRPQVRSMVRHPRTGEQQPSPNANSFSSQAEPSSQPGGVENQKENAVDRLPSLLPIPAPDGFNPTPRWNPGLLRAEDMTALRPIAPREYDLAGQSKPILWASFKREAAETERQSIGNEYAPAASHAQPLPPQHDNGLRPIPPAADPVFQPARRSSGWKVSR